MASSALGHALAKPFLVAGSCLACVGVRCGVSLTFALRRRDTPSLGTAPDTAMTKSYGAVTIHHVLPRRGARSAPLSRGLAILHGPRDMVVLPLPS